MDFRHLFSHFPVGPDVNNIPHLDTCPSFWPAPSPAWGRTPARKTNILSAPGHTLCSRGNSGACPRNKPPARVKMVSDSQGQSFTCTRVNSDFQKDVIMGLLLWKTICKYVRVLSNCKHVKYVIGFYVGLYWWRFSDLSIPRGWDIPFRDVPTLKSKLDFGPQILKYGRCSKKKLWSLDDGFFTHTFSLKARSRKNVTFCEAAGTRLTSYLLVSVLF